MAKLDLPLNHAARLNDCRSSGIRHEINWHIDDLTAADHRPGFPPGSETVSWSRIGSRGVREAVTFKLSVSNIEVIAILGDVLSAHSAHPRIPYAIPLQRKIGVGDPGRPTIALIFSSAVAVK